MDIIIGFLLIFVQFNTSKLFCVFFSIARISILGFSCYKMSFIVVNEFLMQKLVSTCFLAVTNLPVGRYVRNSAYMWSAMKTQNQTD